MSMGERLDKLAETIGLHGFTLWKGDDYYQASVRTGPNNSWRVQRGATPSEAINKALDMDYVEAIDAASGVAGAPFIAGRAEMDFADAAIAEALAEEGESDAAFEGDDPDGDIFG